MDSDFLQGVKEVFGSDEKKEFVDPYFIAGFAGTKVCNYLSSATVLYCNLSWKWQRTIEFYITRIPSLEVVSTTLATF